MAYGLELDILSLPAVVSSLRDIKNPILFPPEKRYEGLTRDAANDFQCIVCKEVYNEPVKTRCSCEITLCRKCFELNKRKCPICRKLTTVTENQYIINQLSAQDIRCGCGMMYYYKKRDEHDIICSLSKFQCPKCLGEKVSGPNMLRHLIANHYIEILLTTGKVISS
ncbi:hypothetical protein SteCoe_28387 [Stentor coeruleus]|uniref:RING-type domain-containing protein n=1 Tax=Stentor coeruleus TaxID=5963 RepID=A0A1R2B8X0_9CILI|nr:hypothetical protein SteCoe_28387 [Stentor coeruleus]